jgi:site-specific DNA-adenine methylase
MYCGGKNSGGAYQTIINQIPPHKIYMELFLGSGAVLRNKRPANLDIGVDRDADLIDVFDYARGKNFKFHNSCGMEFLERFEVQEKAADVFIYADPPYLMSTRQSQRNLYKYEMTRTDHIRLLELLKASQCNICISGYESDLYNNMLKDWRKVIYYQTDRAGRRRKECLWCNYPEPEELHDYSFLGDDFIDRQRIRRKIQRHVDRLQQLPPRERNAILLALRQI